MSTVEVVFFQRAAECHYMPDRSNVATSCGAMFSASKRDDPQQTRDTFTRSIKLVTCPMCLSWEEA